ncbi:MAG TPA: hypothetical protein VMS17_29995, partial [Gemmataceae bacterium]|nr:hypothetical protein [Gemmataceae bacterium]
MLFPSWLRSRTSRSPRAQTRRPALRRAARPLSLEQLEDRNLLSAYMVTTTADNGDDINPVPGSLRYAITQVNAGLYNEIDFNITSGSGYNSITGVATIRPPTELPPIANTVFINGYTQAGSSENNLTVGDNAVLRVELDGSLITPIPWLAGLTITADESVVQGLDIHSFYSSSSPSPGTFPSMGIWLQGGTHNHVQGNFIGTDVTGTSAPDGLPDYSSLTINGAMSYGVQVSDGANNNWIGAESRSAANDAAERNVISATGAGVVLRGLGVITSGGYFVPAGGYSNNNVVAGNYIGTDHTGTDALGNWAGIVTLQGTYGDRIGTNGTDAHAAGEGNLISANAVGISFGGGDPNFAAESSALVAGNVIGLNSQGNPLGNLAGGIGASEGSNNITIGGTSSVLANTIAGNDGPGIWVGYLPYFEQNQNGPFLLLETATGIRVQGNSIHDNDGLGIDLGGIYSFNGPDGVTLNGSQTGGEYNGFQTESAPNYWREFPSVTSASSGSSTVVSGTLNGPARTTFTVDVYANPNENASDYFQGQYYGEGQYYLGHATVTTDANGNASFSADFSAANLPGGGLPSGWFISATATDRLGDTSEFSADVTTAPAAQTFSQYLQATLPQNSSDPTVICVQVGPDQTPATVIAAVNGLTNVTLPVTIIYDLGGGTYSTGGVAADPPANVTFVVQNGTLDPASPALTVAGGQISVVNCTLTTSGDAPALLVTGGSVTLSNDNIVQESAVYTEPAISVTGGTVSLGTAANPGDNTLSVNSSGDLVSNTSGNAISVVGDTFEVGGAVLAAPSLSFTA